MKLSKHIKALNRLYGLVRDETHQVVQDGHIHKNYMALNQLETAFHAFIADLERQNLAEGDKDGTH